MYILLRLILHTKKTLSAYENRGDNRTKAHYRDHHITIIHKPCHHITCM